MGLFSNQLLILMNLELKSSVGILEVVSEALTLFLLQLSIHNLLPDKNTGHLHNVASAAGAVLLLWWLNSSVLKDRPLPSCCCWYVVLPADHLNFTPQCLM